MYYQVDDDKFGEGGYDSTVGFSDASIRRGFIRKVYAILLIQLLVTFGIMSIFFFSEAVVEYSRENPGLFYAAIAATFVTMIAMACCENVRRKFPVNVIFLGIFTMCQGYLLGAAASVYEAESVLMAVGITAVVCFAVTIFAFQTKYDFTMMGGFLFVGIIILLCFGFLLIFFHSRVMHLVYACLGALLFTLYLVYDTQIMMGGGKQYAISPEEYIFAALNIYLDVINLFIFILQIVGAARGE